MTYDAANLKERTLARDAHHLLDHAPVQLSTDAGSVTLTPALTELLRKVLERVGKGESVTVLGQAEELSTQQAADLIGVSRPYFIEKLLDERRIPYRKVGQHRRIRLSDVLAFQERDLKERRALADELTRLNQEIDPY